MGWRAIDCFCGAGGFSQGFAQSGVEILAGLDIDSEALATFSANHPKAVPICADIRNISGNDLISRLGVTRDDDQLIMIGCSPCQYWTRINTTKNKSKVTRNLVQEFGSLVMDIRPAVVVVENVPGMLRKAAETPIDRFVSNLVHAGYKVDFGIVNAGQYGVPQNRKRFLLMASRIAPIRIPEPASTRVPKVRDFLASEEFYPISDGHSDTTDFRHSTMRLSHKNQLRIQLTPKSGGTRLAWANREDLQLPTYVGHPERFRDVYARMDWNKPAPTITTKFLSFSNGRFGHPDQNRAISLREGATLQTFPLSYQFVGTLGSVARQIGNAVPPELASHVARAIDQHVR